MLPLGALISAATILVSFSKRTSMVQPHQIIENHFNILKIKNQTLALKPSYNILHFIFLVSLFVLSEIWTHFYIHTYNIFSPI